MKKFVLNAIYFFAILLLVNGLLYFATDKLYFKNYTDNSLHFKSYLLADSHGMPLKNFAEKYGIYNFSASSDSYLDMSRKLNFLIRKTNVDTVYISVDDHTLSPYRERVNNADRSIFFSTPSDHKNYYRYLKMKYLTYYFPLFQPKARTIVGQYIVSKINNLIRIPHPKKSAWAQRKWSELSVAERIAKSEDRLQLQFGYYTESTKLQQTLVQIINTCKAHNIVLIGIKFPLSPDFIQVLADGNYGADKLLRTNGCKVLDYKKVFVGHNTYFENQDHLNEAGGYKFVNLFANSKR